MTTTTPITTAATPTQGVLGKLFSDEVFRPPAPRAWKDLGLAPTFVEALVCKHMAATGCDSGRGIAARLCLPYTLLDPIYAALRARQLLVHVGDAPLGDYSYKLTDAGRERALALERSSAYVGPAPVRLVDYVLSVEAQTIRAEAPKQRHLTQAFAGISVPPGLLDSLGPAINSGAGMFLYGAPGNGKSTLARCITRCFGQQIWVPHCIIDDGQIIKVYDPAHHHLSRPAHGVAATEEDDYDRRWVRIRRPTVIVGGELTMDSLEIRHDARSNVSEAPLQMKSNCGCLLIDDFGRQRIEARELLNRWIIPLEERRDFLTLCTGKKIEVPFEQLIIFSTNLDPHELVDEAFLRRIPYKINVSDPSEQEYSQLFATYAKGLNLEYRPDSVENLLEVHYRKAGRPLRRCQPRDLLLQAQSYCAYFDLPPEMKFEYLDHAARTYFGSGLCVGKSRGEGARPAHQHA